MPSLGQAAEPQPAVVSTKGVAYTPELVATTAVPAPHVDALAQLDATMVAGGLFDTVTQGGVTFTRNNLVAFDRSTGVVSPDFAPVIAGGGVNALAADPATNSVYVGGEFKSVNGVARAGLVKLDATTGAIDTTFVPPFSVGRVHDLKIATIAGVKRLVVGGSMKNKLISVSLTTGRNDGYFRSVIADAIPGAWGGVAVYRVAIDPSVTHLVATGNFQTVEGQSRTRLFMLDLGATNASLSPWYYPGFAKPCASTHARRIAYLQGVDWSPDGSAFNVTATGQIPKFREDVWYSRLGDQNLPDTTVCDAVGRFSLADPTKPVWINYTGGDSVWTVTDTGAAVYVLGHFKWLNNPDGFGSQGLGDKTSGEPATWHPGIGAIDPTTGLSIDAFAPFMTAKLGGKALLADAGGLWIGSDSRRYGTKPHYGIAYAPLLP